MRIDVRSRNGEVPQYFLDHAEPRLSSLSQYLDNLEEVRVVVSQKRGQHTVEITVEEPRNVFRAEKSQGDLLEAFDEAFQAVERQVRRHKRRLRDRGSRQSVRYLAAEESAAEETALEIADEGEGEGDGPQIVRVKSHAVKPMTPEEAALQMEMVGHDFYVFTNARTGVVNVIYRRKSGGYGLIEPNA